ncbi:MULTISPECIES: glycosyltransferase family 2 protein [Brochothrix]|uniref:Glycosyltransferase family 2 protein n=1 Tax=Brochothrix thermosphacta TaxID=2756 RepID=A0A1D2LFY1_BROTH|nr:MULTISPECIES: glycosyltransferase family 2 protein [Brochothrix]ATF26155.1 glycosyltransferase family 2 protein [Brochothrix thermosphacta]ATH85494.1 glycosyltransferase family 2 protein [Brochothrix thermosphacta]MBR5526383.1 glycosyltransferase family 2 protein [Brochothrix sp.]MPQ29081.1 glycosyltransferase family 2 protein [Brochothrix thermosphacta]ODJ67395.1 hypothetical protein BFR36_06250 [Brochothrix thermosphacta]
MVMEQDKQLVSVIVPTYCRPVAIIERAIASIAAQTYERVEIILVDDNAEHPEYRENNRRAFSNRDQLVLIENEKNLGGALSRNAGIVASQGSHITFLDDDDKYLPEKIAKQLAFMQEVACDLSFANLNIVNQQEKTVDYREFSNLVDFKTDTLMKYHLQHHITGTPTFMFKREALFKIELFDDISMGQEYILMLKAIEQKLTIRYFDSCDVVAYRHDLGSISQGRNKIIGEKNMYKIKETYFDQLNTKEINYVKFRHRAVLTVAYKRNKQITKALGLALYTACSHPLVLMQSVYQFIRKIQMNRQELEK